MGYRKFADRALCGFAKEFASLCKKLVDRLSIILCPTRIFIKMNSQELLKFFAKRGFLVDKGFVELLDPSIDKESLELFIGILKTQTSERILTEKVFYKELGAKVVRLLSSLPEQKRKGFEKLKIKLGLSIELEQDSKNLENIDKKDEADEQRVKLVYGPSAKNKKLEVTDFVTYFRNRFLEMQRILQGHRELENLISINKLSASARSVSLIGMVKSKSVTRNGNIIFDIEDLTGSARVLVGKNDHKLYEKAEDVALDSVMGFVCSGTKRMLFAKEIVFPDAFLQEKKRAPVEEYALFIGDLHFGSKRFMEQEFLNFIDYLNGKFPGTSEQVSKIKYLFIVGDVVTGIGNYPNQEQDITLHDLEEQYIGVAKLLKKIRSDIHMIICPGNHDGVRLMEPQPIFDEKYAWPLYNLKNVFLVGNPCVINIGQRKGFPGFNVLCYHGFSYPYYANTIPRFLSINAFNNPTRVMEYLLRHRHLAPTHGSVQYFPLEEDAHLIREVPDIFVSAHSHKSEVSHYNNVLLVSVSCWESLSPYQERLGNEPDHCKVPMFNLKTGEMKILDFEGK